MDILITEDINGRAIKGLEERYEVLRDESLWKDPKALSARLADARAVIIRNQTKINPQALQNAGSLMVIGRAGVGYDNIDIESASKAGIVVTYAPNENSISTAEQAFALILALYRKTPPSDFSTKNGGWDRYSFVGHELFGKTVGILGLGRVGARVAVRARAFGMKVIAYDKFISRHEYVVTENSAELRELRDLLAEADIVSCHLPSNDDTRRLIDYSKLKLMKKGSIIINTSRGDVIVESDLIRALKEGIIAGAGLDVREKEPPAESELNHMDNVVLTPHIAGLTIEAQDKVVETVANDVDRVLQGLPAVNYVNFPLRRIGAIHDVE